MAVQVECLTTLAKELATANQKGGCTYDFNGLPSVLDVQLVDLFLQFHNFFCLDLNVRGLTLHSGK
jgi:hypothetical protein